MVKLSAPPQPLLKAKRKNRFKRLPAKSEVKEENLMGSEKNNTEGDVFNPTFVQQRFCVAYLSDECKGSISKASKIAGVNRQIPYRWIKDPAFESWFREESRRYCVALEGLKLQAYRIGLKKGNPLTLRIYEERFGNIAAQEGSGKVEVIFETVSGKAPRASKQQSIHRS